MIDLISSKHDRIAELCRQFRIRKLDVFGSAATGAFNPESSDSDLVVDLGEYEPGVTRRFMGFADALESELGHRVELITEAQIQNPYFRHAVNQQRETLYEAGDGQAAA